MPDKTEWNPGKLFEISGYYWKTCTLHAAVKLEIFTLVGKEKMTADEIAAKADCPIRGMKPLLNALSAMDLLTKDEQGRYANSESGHALLSKDSPRYTGHIIMHHHHLVNPWASLDQAVKTGAPVKQRSSFNDEQRESFLMGMFNIAMGLAPQVAKTIDLSGTKNLLDLGGGPGTYAIHFCMENPELSATVFDLPTTRPFAEKTIARFNLSERVTFSGGNFLTDGIPGTYDAVWISHILHSEGPEECLALLKKAAATLTEGGKLMIHEFILDNSLDRPLFPALFSLNMLIDNPHGQAYSEEQLFNMLDKAGLKDIKRLSFTGPNDSGIVSAVK